MLEKEFIPPTESLELREIGFNEPCFGYYGDNLELIWKSVYAPWINSERNLIDNNFCTAPTFSQVFKWFRKKHNLHAEPSRVEIGLHSGVFNHRFFIHDNNNGIVGIIEDEIYEEAELACLRKLIQIVKNK